VRSFFKKNESKPPMSGTKNRNKTIIFNSKFKSQNAKGLLLYFDFLLFNFYFRRKNCTTNNSTMPTTINNT
jgi:hypothetical protein